MHMQSQGQAAVMRSAGRQNLHDVNAAGEFCIAAASAGGHNAYLTGIAQKLLPLLLSNVSAQVHQTSVTKQGYVCLFVYVNGIQLD